MATLSSLPHGPLPRAAHNMAAAFISEPARENERMPKTEVRVLYNIILEVACIPVRSSEVSRWVQPTFTGRDYTRVWIPGGGILKDPVVSVSALEFTMRTSNKYTPNWSQSGKDGGHRGRHKFRGSSERSKILWLEESVRFPGGGGISNGL